MELTTALEQANAAYAAQDWETAAQRYAAILAEHGYQALRWWYRRLGWCTKHLPAEQQVALWEASWDEVAKTADQCLSSARRGEFDLATHQFDGLIELVPTEEAAKADWRAAFRAVCAVKAAAVPYPRTSRFRRRLARLQRRLTRRLKREIARARQAIRPHAATQGFCPKIMVAGHGWSGSTALYDYFCEFADAAAVKGEIALFWSRPNLGDLWQTLQRGQPAEDILIDYFGAGLLGAGVWRDYHAGINIFKARRYATNQGSRLSYARAARRFCERLAQSAQRRRLSAESFAETAARLIDDVVSALSPADERPQPAKSRVILLDNPISMPRLDLSGLVRNATIFCVYRDMRSTYVSRKREAGVGAETIDQYLDSRHHNPWRVRQLVRELKVPNRIIEVQFEEFVTSRAYRLELAQQAGLDASAQNEFSFFRPWESIKNVFLHEGYEHPEEIRRIEEAFPEFCRDLEALRTTIDKTGWPDDATVD